MPFFGRSSSADQRKAQEWAQWFAQRNPLAIVSFVLGVFSFIEFGVLLVFGVAGIVLGVLSLRQLRNPAANDLRTKGHFLAWAGIGLSVASLIIAIFFLRVLG
jgi:FtsH-binding integral membrane protein